MSSFSPAPRTSLTNHMHRGIRAALVAAPALIALAMALVPSIAVAQACNSNPNNCGMDTTRTSSLTVYHSYTNDDVNFFPVEPDTGETWSVTAWYRLVTAFTGCDCALRSDTVAVDVDWNGTSWVASCTGCGGGSPILGVSVCPVDGCGEGVSLDHSWAYELIVDVDNNVLFNCGHLTQTGALKQVDYSATSIDDGDRIDLTECAEDLVVTPSAVGTGYIASDTGAFECPFTCEDASGPTLTIYYE